MDEDNEEVTASALLLDAHVSKGEDCLIRVLEGKQLLDDRLRAELKSVKEQGPISWPGVQYWKHEREICRHLKLHRAHHHAVAAGSGKDLETAPSSDEECFNIAQVLATSRAKSFDYRVLHLLLFRLLNKGYDEQLLEFLAVDEHLVDVGDDLVDYEDDVLQNSFNIYRGFIHIYKEAAQMEMVKYISELESDRDSLLARLPPEIAAKVLLRQREAMTAPGSEKWIVPPPIYDEEHYCNAPD
eukprot:jgi/Botrbrau1/22841/Bobra.0065s0002.4